MSVRHLKNVSSDIFSDIHPHVVTQICTLIMDWHQNHFYVKTNPIKLWLLVYNTCDDRHILIGSYLWSIGEQMLRWCHHQHILASLLHKKLDSMLSWVCSVTDDCRRGKCGRNINDTLGSTSVPLFGSHLILMLSVIYYWTDTLRHGTYLLFIIQFSSPPTYSVPWQLQLPLYHFLQL